MIDKSAVKRLAIQWGFHMDFLRDKQALLIVENFAQAVIKAYVAEQEVAIWLTQKEFDTLKRAQKTDRETIPLYALPSGEPK